MKRIGLVLVLLVACGSKHDNGPGYRVDELVARANEALPKIRAGLAAGQLDGLPSCPALLVNVDLVEQEGGHADVVAAIKRTCQHDLPVAHMQHAVDTAEAARKARPGDKVLGACFNSEYDTAVQHLNEARVFDQPAEALQARWMAACPVI